MHLTNRFTVRLLSTICLLALAAACYAKPQFLQAFNDFYKPDQNSPLGKAGCMICHTAPPKRNAYGKDLRDLMDKASTNQVTAEILKQAEGLDSDGDGFSNGEEIKAGFLPGDPESHPAGSPKKSGGAKPDSSGGSAKGSVIPSHGYHPAFVHFPIALFLFGMILELCGLRKQNAAVTAAAYWNLLGALASLAIVVPTGVYAWLVGGHALEGNMLIHLILAVSSLALMSGTLAARKKLGADNKTYLAILVLTAFIVAATGHFGGQMVFG